MRLACVAAIALSACTGLESGPCAPASDTPLKRAELVGGIPGEDTAHALRFTVNTGAIGECFHPHRHWVRLDGGVDAVLGPELLDPKPVGLVGRMGSRSTYRWDAGNADVVVEQPTVTELKISVDFAEGSKVALTCTTTTGKSLVCQ